MIGVGVVLMLFRPEAADSPDQPHLMDPFDGVELHAFVEDESAANDAIDLAVHEHRARHGKEPVGWKWLMEPLR